VNFKIGGEMFNFTGVQASGFEVLPAGWYRAFVDEATFHDTKAGTGEYLKTKFVLLDQPYEGRGIFGMYNLSNPNPKAVEIAMRDMVSMLIAMGYNKDELGELSKEALIDKVLQKQVQIKLKIRRSDEYGDQNNVCGYRGIDTELKASSTEPTGDVPF
jgi:hypothetical protein